MVSFKRTTQLLGVFSFFLLLGIFAFLFFGFVEKESLPVGHVHFSVKEKAHTLDIWRFSGDNKYHIVASSMVKQENGVVLLIDDKLWIFEPNKPPAFLRSDKAYIYPNHNVKASGHVFFRRDDLRIYGKTAFWNNKDQVLSSDDAFHGSNKKSKFKGKSFIYFSKVDKLLVNGVDIWIK